VLKCYAQSVTAGRFIIIIREIEVNKKSVSPKKSYSDTLYHARDREIIFNLTYSEYLELWLVSGKWEFKGTSKGSYQMCRYGDTGPYSINNCRIDTVENNQMEKYTKHDGGNTQDILVAYLEGSTQRTIANEFNLSQSGVSRIINGKRRVHEQRI